MRQSQTMIPIGSDDSDKFRWIQMIQIDSDRFR